MLSNGSRIGGLLIHEMVGRGAMGEVYRAEQINLKRPVAVKRIAAHLADQASVVARFEREARIVATLNSPYVVQVYEFGPYTDEQGEGHLLLVMEWIDGGRSLRQCMRDQVGMAWSTVARIMHQASVGLQIAHEQSIVHRDIKPDNMLISPKGEIKLADFGLAQASDSSALTMEGSVIGTPNYLSPEGCNGKEIGVAGDVYSLGATCFHLLTGVPVFTASTTLGLLRAHVEQDVPKLANYVPDIPPAFAELVEACLQKEEANRIASAKDLRERLESLEKDGLQFDNDLNELVAMADKLQEPSTLATDIDVHAETNVSAQVARTLASRSNSASTTAETVIQADISSNSADTLVAPIEQNKSEPISQSDGSAVTTPTSAASNDKKRVGSLIPAVIVLVIAICAAVFFVLQSDPIKDACNQIEANVQSGELEIALSVADKLVNEHPGEKRVHAAFRSIIAAETQQLIDKQRFDENLKRLDEHRQRYTWLAVDEWIVQTRIAKAQDLVKRKYNRDAASEYVALRKDFPKNKLVARAFLEDFGHGRYQYREPNVFNAAVYLTEAGENVDQLIGDTLLMAYLEARLEGEWTDKLRGMILQHYRDQAVTQSRERLIHERDNIRIHSYNLLHAAEAIAADERMRHHLRNHFNLHMSHDDWEASFAWISEQSDAGAWQNHKQGLDFSSFGIPKYFTSSHERNDPSLKLIATAFMPEMQSVIVDWAKNEEKDAVRYNAYLVLQHANALNRIDEWAFHEKTLNNFYAAYHTPEDFELALAYFKQHLTDDVRREAARKVLAGGREYLVEYLEAIKKHSRYKASIPNCEANIAALDAVLNPKPKALP